MAVKMCLSSGRSVAAPGPRRSRPPQLGPTPLSAGLCHGGLDLQVLLCQEVSPAIPTAGRHSDKCHGRKDREFETLVPGCGGKWPGGVAAFGLRFTLQWFAFAHLP